MHFSATVTLAFVAFIGAPILTAGAATLTGRQGTCSEEPLICDDTTPCSDGCDCTPIDGQLSVCVPPEMALHMRRAPQSDACESVLCQNSNDCCESFNCVGILGGEAICLPFSLGL